jgi:hypothetical protein
MSGGPLGKYSQSVAATVAVSVIAAAILARFVGEADSFIDNMALIAMGAVFGAAASTAVNGDKVEAAHRRLDIIAAPPAQASTDPLASLNASARHVEQTVDAIAEAVNGPATIERHEAAAERARVQERDSQ